MQRLLAALDEDAILLSADLLSGYVEDEVLSPLSNSDVFQGGGIVCHKDVARHTSAVESLGSGVDKERFANGQQRALACGSGLGSLYAEA